MEFPFLAAPKIADLVLVNPQAGGGRARAVVAHLQDFALQRAWDVEICITRSAEEMSIKAREAAQGGRSRIFVLGGDGTFQIVLNAVADYPDIVLGVIPAGGGNDLAAALGLPDDPIGAAAMLLNAEVFRSDALRVRTSEGTERLCSGGGGVGVDAEAARYANGSYRNLRGRARYLLSTLRALLGFQAIRVRITIDDNNTEVCESTVLLAAALNTPSYGAGVHFAPAAKMDDGKMEVVLLQKLHPMEILGMLPSFVARGALKTTRIDRQSVRSMRLETEVPSWFQGDGELLGRTPVEIAVVPGAFRVLRPRQRTNG